jgi:hypothetical protein
MSPNTATQQKRWKLLLPGNYKLNRNKKDRPDKTGRNWWALIQTLSAIGSPGFLYLADFLNSDI